MKIFNFSNSGNRNMKKALKVLSSNFQKSIFKSIHIKDIPNLKDFIKSNQNEIIQGYFLEKIFHLKLLHFEKFMNFN